MAVYCKGLSMDIKLYLFDERHLQIRCDCFVFFIDNIHVVNEYIFRHDDGLPVFWRHLTVKV